MVKNMPKKPVSSESVARLADAGANVSHFFTNEGQMSSRSNVPNAFVHCSARLKGLGDTSGIWGIHRTTWSV